MIVSVNGEPHQLPAAASVADAIALIAQSVPGRGYAVAVGGEVIPRGEWASTELADGSRVELVAAIQGG